jgi:hypothetical protein
LAPVNRQREEPDVQWKAAAFARWHEPLKRSAQCIIRRLHTRQSLRRSRRSAHPCGTLIAQIPKTFTKADSCIAAKEQRSFDHVVGAGKT